MNLYEIKGSIEAFLSSDEFVNAETGEINETALLKLNELEETETAKLEGIGCYIKNLSSETEAIKTEISNLKARADSKAKKAESLKKYIADYLQTVGKNKFETSKINLSFRKSKSLFISNEKAVFEAAKINNCLNYKDPEIDKVKIKDLINNGIVINGAEIVEKQNLQIK